MLVNVYVFDFIFIFVHVFCFGNLSRVRLLLKWFLVCFCVTFEVLSICNGYWEPWRIGDINGIFYFFVIPFYIEAFVTIISASYLFCRSIALSRRFGFTRKDAELILLATDFNFPYIFVTEKIEKLKKRQRRKSQQNALHFAQWKADLHAIAEDIIDGAIQLKYDPLDYHCVTSTTIVPGVIGCKEKKGETCWGEKEMFQVKV